MRKVGEDCYQWGNQKVYCGAGAYEKAVAQGQAIYQTGWREAETESIDDMQYLLDEIKRTWHSNYNQITEYVEHTMAGDGLIAYWDMFDLPNGEQIDENTTKEEYFEKMFQSFYERFAANAQVSTDERGLEVVGHRILYVPVGTKINTESLGNWENRKADQYGVFDDPITSWLWSDDIYTGVIFGDDSIDHMEGIEGKDFDRIVLSAWIGWEAVDWASTIAFNISGFWQECELCVFDKATVYDLDIYRNGNEEAILEKAMNAEFEAPYQPDQTMQDYTLSELTTSSAVSGYQPYKYSASHGAESEEQEFIGEVPIIDLNSIKEIEEYGMFNPYEPTPDYKEQQRRESLTDAPENNNLFRITCDGVYAVRTIYGPSKIIFGRNMLASNKMYFNRSTQLNLSGVWRLMGLPRNNSGVVSAFGPLENIEKMPQFSEKPEANVVNKQQELIPNRIVINMKGLVFAYDIVHREVEFYGGVPESSIVSQDIPPEVVKPEMAKPWNTQENARDYQSILNRYNRKTRRVMQGLRGEIDVPDEEYIDYWNQFAAEDNYDATYGKRQAAIRRRLKKKIKAQNVRGTAAGEWSARKSQLLKEKYEAACERANIRPYKGKKTQSQKNLSNWSKQDWRTASGRKSSVTGEPYFPAKAVEALKKKGLYAKARRQKRAATKAGKQNARYSDDIRKIVKRFRAEDDAPEFWQVIETDEGSALYRKIIDLTYNQVWRLLELIDDLNRMTKHHALTKFGANEVEIWVYTHDKNSITAKDYHWTEDFNEMFETVDWKHFKVEEMPDWDDIEWKDDYISPQKGPEDWGEDVEWEAENAKTTSSVVFVHPRSGKIGLQLRSSRVNEPDTWAAVGGYIDDGEHPHRAAYREIEEELGIDLRAHGLKLVSNDYPHFIYRMDVPVMFRPFLNWESRDFAWKHPSEWKAMSNIHPELKPVLQARIFGAEEKDKEKAKLISLNMVDETDPSMGRNIDDQIAWQLKGYSKINEDGNIGCPECGSVDLFAREFTDKGVKWNCWNCMYSRKIETLKSQKDITLEKFGLVFPCAKCGKDIKAFNRYSLILHQRKCGGKK